MLETIYLHIGSHKTGTSSIQCFLEKNRESLIENYSLTYYKPDIWPLKFIGGKPDINLQLDGFDSLKQVQTNFAIISHENYSWLTSIEDIARLYTKLSMYAKSIKIILYLRRQDSLAISQKQEGTKWMDNSIAFGHNISALPVELNSYASMYLDFYTKVNKWAECFGKENMIIRLFEPNYLLNYDVVDDFLSVLNVFNGEKFINIGKVNESISKIKQVFLHQTRWAFPEDSSGKELLVKRVLRMKLEGDNQKLLPSRADALQFYEQFIDGNIKLNDKYRLSDAEYLFSNDFKMYPEETTEEPLSTDQVIKIFSNIIKDFAEEIKEQDDYQKNSEKIAFWLRDVAKNVEESDLELALKLMMKAKSLKGNGPYINRKIEEYRFKLNLKNKDMYE